MEGSMSDKTLTIQNIRKLVAVVVVLSMSACSAARPNARLLGQVPKSAPANYQQGWIDGCETGMAATGGPIYQVAYQNKINPQLVENTQYFRGWNEAKTYCAHYTMALLWEGGVLPQTPTEENDNGILPSEPKSVYAVAASWGAPTFFNWDGTDAPEAESEGALGFSYASNE